MEVQLSQNDVTYAYYQEKRLERLQAGKSTWTRYWPIYEAKVADFLDELKSLEPNLLYAQGEKTKSVQFIIEGDGYLVILYQGYCYLAAHTDTRLEEIDAKIRKFESQLEKVAPQRLFTVVRTRDGFEFQSITMFKDSIVTANYDERVISAAAHVTADLDSKKPCGRFSLFYGPPGTGKTHILKSIIASAKESAFVLVTPRLLAMFSEPDFMPSLINFHRDEASGKSITFVVEDAESILLPRMSDNSTSISSLLNMTDGMLGAALDIRVIATTNAKRVEIDPAILRPGRTCRHVEVPFLTRDKANGRLVELAGGEGNAFGKEASLAEVYAAARSRSNVA